MEEMGFKPVLGDHVQAIHGFMAGEDDARLADLHRFIGDPSIGGVFCLHGGYGSLHLVDKIDYDLLAANPKVFVGSDDNTSWLLAAHARLGLVYFHGPNLSQVTSRKVMLDLKQAVTQKSLLPALRTADMWPQTSLEIEFAYAPVAGTASGALLGGNLTALVSLMGTPYQPDFAETILFLEDVNERNDILERWFTQLCVSGQLEKTNAVAFGQFEGCGPQHSDNLLSLEDTFGDRMRQAAKPCCFDLAIGQTANCRYVPVGIAATLECEKGVLSFDEPALS